MLTSTSKDSSQDEWTEPIGHQVQSSSAPQGDTAHMDSTPGEKVPIEPGVEESMDARIERLGRERPAIFKSIWAELAFVFSIYMSQILTEYFVSGFSVIRPILIQDLNIPQAASVWPATAFSLVIAATLLVFGRLGDMWGGYPVFMGGMAWLVLWSVVCGFSTNPIMLDICRALQGLGPAASLPTGVMLMGTVYRPGPRKNMVFGLYGLFAVLGFYFGIFCAGVIGQYIRWGWYFWIGAILTLITLVTSAVSVPNDRKERLKNGITMDWLGAGTIVPGIVLFVFAITQSAHVEKGWRQPYIPTLFCVGCLFLMAAVYVEGWVAKEPLLPPDIFTTPRMTQLTIALLLLYGNCGIYLLYGVQYFQDIMGATPLQVVAWMTPIAVGGIILNVLEGFALHLLPGRLFLVVSGVAALGWPLLLAFVPEGGSYWAWIFPSNVMVTMSIDLSYALICVFITTTLPSARQGLAGGLINSVMQLGMAIVLGFSDIVQSYTVDSAGLRQSYKNTFWFGVATGAVSLVLLVVWGKIDKAKSDLTADEKLELQREAMTASRENGAET
ncbi:MFS transporter [Exophiala viscosa]|uniref:MFS transporter n=1 Tax=Exophiala viscosa TaxID=2486360 RepID=UPI0021968E5E|nr:MFS transporter [Exophiala viscosa]